MDIVVILTSGRHNQADLEQDLNPVEVQVLIPDPAIEALDVDVLDGFPWSIEVLSDALVMRPLVERFADEHRPVVCHDHGRLSTLSHNVAEEPGHVRPEAPPALSKMGLFK